MKNLLNNTQRAFYDQEGYLLPPQPILPSAEFSALHERFESIANEWEQEHQIRPEHIDVPHLYHPDLFRWLCNDQVLDLVEEIVGPDIVLFSSHFICKPPGTGQRVPWHEDSSYWAHYNIDPMDIVTIWLAIDESSPENGCMQVIPKSHLSADSAYHELSSDDNSVFATEINQDQFDVSSAVDCVLKPNHASLHHGKLIHGSHANTSNKRRCGYTMRFMSSRCHIKNIGDHHVFLVRGQAQAPNHYSEIGTTLRHHVQNV